MKVPAAKSATAERAAFSERLRRAISQFDDSLLSATVLAREYNRRSRTSTVGVTGVQKWLGGEAIPQQDKLVFLANWLRVSVQWLRFGDSGAHVPISGKYQRRLDRIVSDFSALSERDKALVERLMREMLLLKEKEPARTSA
ncbi:MAG: hypothetical protein JSS58_06585 [Proteobacteria bacterium]|nr:hypothetical protein [Pseudomonadota bacterium]